MNLIEKAKSYVSPKVRKLGSVSSQPLSEELQLFLAYLDGQIAGAQFAYGLGKKSSELCGLTYGFMVKLRKECTDKKLRLVAQPILGLRMKLEMGNGRKKRKKENQNQVCKYCGNIFRRVISHIRKTHPMPVAPLTAITSPFASVR